MKHDDKILITPKGNKSFDDILSEVYLRSNTLSSNINGIIESLAGILNSSETQIDELVTLLPLVKDLFNTSIKNDDQLIKIAANLNKLISSSDGDAKKIEAEINDWFDDIQNYEVDTETKKLEVGDKMKEFEKEITDEDIKELEGYSPENDELRDILG